MFIFYICETGHLNIFPADCAQGQSANGAVHCVDCV
ncbi:iron-sulfur protein [Shigella sonnei]|nr:iron-sulfur protein [Shigella sonnei]EFX0518238.1 iron-sulfur protein [Shigella sonnei]